MGACGRDPLAALCRSGVTGGYLTRLGVHMALLS